MNQSPHVFVAVASLSYCLRRRIVGKDDLETDCVRGFHFVQYQVQVSVVMQGFHIR